MTNSRSLTIDEIALLQQNGCWAEDWGNISVAEDFDAQYVSRVAFYGKVQLGVFDETLEIDEGFHRHSGIFGATLRDVEVGDNCLIENVGCYISRYTIGDECFISNVGIIATNEGATFGEGNTISVMNEAGEGNIILYDRLSSQSAALMVRSSLEKNNSLVGKKLFSNETNKFASLEGSIGYRVKIVNTKEIVNTIVSDECEINGASRIADCTLSGTPEASIYIGNDVIIENSIVQAGASIVGGAKVDNCLVGEACHVGKGFSAESSVFFANSYMDNGEACASFCGPFSVSHHKSTLIIGAMVSFYNAGSTTNFSNHAYKLGPIHYGTLERGTKTASGAHTLLPAQIGAFSMVMGKIVSHPDTRRLPFSYVIANGSITNLVPGRNLATVGTYRDTRKWRKRDLRPLNGRISLINFDWLNPVVIDECIGGIKMLESLRSEQGENSSFYNFEGLSIKGSSLQKGIKFYEMAIKMFVGQMMERRCKRADGSMITSNLLPASSVGSGAWLDLGGMLAPTSEIEQLEADIADGIIMSIEEMERQLADIHAHYNEYAWAKAYRIALDYYRLDTIAQEDIAQIEADYQAALNEWKMLVKRDAEREFLLGDVSEKTLNDFIEKVKG